MKNTLAILTMAILLLQCTNGPQADLKLDRLGNTNWELQIADGCVSTITLLAEKKYNSYNCEMEDSLYGFYHIENDKLILIQEGSIYDNLYEEGSSQRMGKARFTLTLKANKLYYIKRENFLNGEWIESKHSFAEDYCYELVL